MSKHATDDAHSSHSSSPSSSSSLMSSITPIKSSRRSPSPSSSVSGSNRSNSSVKSETTPSNPDLTKARRYRPMIMAPHTSDSETANINNESSGRPLNRGGVGWFPLGYKEAASQWWSSISPRVAERNVLKFIPFLREANSSHVTQSASSTSAAATGKPDKEPTSTTAPNREGNDPYGNRIWRSTMVPLSGQGRALNEFSIERLGEAPAEETLVVLHGYGAGLGFFYKNFEPLTRLPGWRLFALDMLGMGNSSRPPFRITAKDQQGKIEQTESWFIDSLEEWRGIRKIDHFTLMGHSMGGYLAVSYALKYPGRINKLILVSPVGIPEDPYAVNADMPEPEESTVIDEVMQDQNETTKNHGGGSKTSTTDRKRAVPNPGGATSSENSSQPRKRPMPGWFTWLWDANVSPFSIVRFSGPLGPRFVSGWTSRRFNHLPADEARALHDYAYSLFKQRGSGEYALPYLLAPGAYARSPVLHRIHKVGRQPLPTAVATATAAAAAAAASATVTSVAAAPAPGSATATSPAAPLPAPSPSILREAGYPIVMMYGENDWMDVAGGYAAQELVRAACQKRLLDQTVTDEERRRENGSADVLVVPAAGHHLYLDNPEVFNSLVLKELRQTQAWMKKMRTLLPVVP